MPNVVQRFARRFVKRLQRVASSTSSPPVIRPTGDVPDETIPTEFDPNGTENLEIVVQGQTIDVELNSQLSNSETPHSLSSLDTLECIDDVDDDVMRELETLKTLRIEEALEESKKIQETFRETRSSSSIKRLMKELRQLLKASEESDGTFEVEPCGNADSDEPGSDLQEWEVRFYKFDESSQLWRSMQDFGVECVTFRITFPTDFPFSPPFVRLVSPYIENGFVMNGGAICLEILTHQGWSSAYTVEALLVQVAASLSHGGAVISKHQKRKQHKLTKKRAEVEFRRIVKIHNKYGWVKLEKGEG
uniref:Ubiquitin-conjugating enzyme E2Q-like protein CG4502 n=1 Tax=Phallusia mammillata TaxID=59560 RepID=A0A6F9DWA2_9ASCI|nr:ubiquitin-conjugating enzyme E2Q-like protein CG4502 [Phallusia mammillata]